MGDVTQGWKVGFETNVLQSTLAKQKLPHQHRLHSSAGASQVINNTAIPSQMISTTFQTDRELAIFNNYWDSADLIFNSLYHFLLLKKISVCTYKSAFCQYKYA